MKISKNKDWTNGQNEVWDTVATYTKLIVDGNKEQFLKYIHNEYTGWNDIEPLPVDKCSIINELDKSNIFPKIYDYSIIPTRLKVFRDVAIVHYYLKIVFSDKVNYNTPLIKRYTDVLIKYDKKWLLIADHFGIQRKEIESKIQ